MGVLKGGEVKDEVNKVIFIEFHTWLECRMKKLFGHNGMDIIFFHDFAHLFRSGGLEIYPGYVFMLVTREHVIVTIIP